MFRDHNAKLLSDEEMNFWAQLKLFFSVKLLKFVFCVLLPFILIPLAVSEDKEVRCVYVIIVVASYWLLEPVPISVTALLPIVLFPLLGVLHSPDVCITYMNETFMMFIGGLIVAIAVESCRLHERIALKVLLVVGTEAVWLMLGFMLTTMFLSMWISNTATTAMMVPIVEAVVFEMSRNQDLELDAMCDDSPAVSQDNTFPQKERKMSQIHDSARTTMKTALLLSVCYSANIGGTGTITGTGPNLVFKAIMEDLHPQSDDINFASWMMYNIPGMIVCVLLAWFYLYIIYVRCAKVTKSRTSNSAIRDIILKRYRSLGSIRFEEVAVSVVFITLVFLWIFRKPKFVAGWVTLFSEDIKIGDSVPSIALAFLMFLLPMDPKRFVSGRRLLEWKYVQSKLPWGVILLCGGGFAIAKGAKESGLSNVVGEYLSTMHISSSIAITMVICLLTAALTELVNNTTVATIFLPVVSQMAISMRINPLFLMLPATVSCSYAFMLPIATPPNAIAFESGSMKTVDMAKPGFIMNVICCCIQVFMINTLGIHMFNLNEFPDWVPLNTSLSENNTMLET